MAKIIKVYCMMAKAESSTEPKNHFFNSCTVAFNRSKTVGKLTLYQICNMIS